MPPSWQVGPWADAGTARHRARPANRSARVVARAYILLRGRAADTSPGSFPSVGFPRQSSRRRAGAGSAVAPFVAYLRPAPVPTRGRRRFALPSGALSYCHAGSLDPLQRTSAREENNHEMVQKKKRSCLYEGMIPTVAKLHV